MRNETLKFLTADAVARALARRGYIIQSAEEAEDESVDAEVKLSDKVSIQVGATYLIVGRQEGEGEDWSIRHWPSRDGITPELFRDLDEAFTYERAFFAIDDGKLYEGIHHPQRHWNGWKLPAFAFEAAQAIAKDMSNGEGKEDDDTMSVRYDPARDAFIERIYGEEYFGPCIEFEGKKYYVVGSGWCWSAYSMEEAASMKERLS
jgi:hypothetical protein